MLPKPASLLCVLLAGLALSSCSIAGPAAGPQLIVKLRPGTVACDAAGVQKLAQQSDQKLQLVRPMSGDACLLRVPDAAALPPAIDGLQKLPDVEWAEADAVMRANPR